MNPLIYINSVSKYPLALALRMGLDVAAAANWNEIMAMASVSIVPLVIMFFCLQKVQNKWNSSDKLISGEVKDGKIYVSCNGAA